MERKRICLAFIMISILGVFLFCAIVGIAWSQEAVFENQVEVGAVMRPDLETLRRWTEEYKGAPRAHIDKQIRSMLTHAEEQNLGTSVNLLSHLQYIPTVWWQGDCGDCWVWAGTGVLQIALDVQKGIYDRLSEQFFGSCYPYSDSACCGGSLTTFASWYGGKGYAIPWSNAGASFYDMLTSCGGGATMQCQYISTTPNYPIKSISATVIPTQGVSQATAVANIKNVLNQGKGIWWAFNLPHQTAFNDFNVFWNLQPESDIWDPDFYCGQTWNNGIAHAVLIVGYDDSATVPYWLALNSWGGPSNRSNGLFRLKMNLNYNCKHSDFNSLAFWTLNVTFGDPPPSTPLVAKLISPSGAITDNAPTFTWNSAYGATSYYLWVDDSAGQKIGRWYTAEEAGCSAWGAGIECWVTHPALLAQGSGRWRVQTRNDYGDGPWSDWMAFDVNCPAPAAVTLVMPSGSTLTNKPTYSWDAVSDVETYFLWVYDSSGNKVIDEYYTPTQAGCSSGTGPCNVTPSRPLDHGNAVWYVRPWNHCGYGPTTNMGFTVAPEMPGQATLVWPSGTITTNTPTYIWNAVSHATLYHLYVNDSTGNKIDAFHSAAQAACPDGSGTCSLTPAAPLQPGDAVWWVQTANEYGDGPWSTSLAFNVQSPGLPPGEVTLISPSGTITTNTPVYSWTSLSDATSYHLYVNDSTGNKIDHTYSASEAGCVPVLPTAGGASMREAARSGMCVLALPTELAEGLGQWRVQAANNYGAGPWSGVLGFNVVTQPPGAAALVSPSGAITTSTPAYVWNAVSAASSYLLWVNDSTGNKIKHSYSAAQTGCSGGAGTCSATPGTVLALGPAMWWIQTSNSLGVGPWSNGMAFRVTPEMPGKATLNSPSGEISTTTPTYNWNAVSNSSWYYLWVNDTTGTKIKRWYSAAEAGCSGGAGTCSAMPGTVLAHGSATWWILTWNASGYGPWSDPLSFFISGGQCTAPPTAATLVSPSGTIYNAKPDYTWNAVPCATWYRLWVKDSTGNKIDQWYTAAQAGCDSGAGTCKVAPGVALAKGSASWWIQTYGDAGAGPWSSRKDFTVGGQTGHIHYEIDKIVGTNYYCQPRDTYHESSGDLPGLQGTIPISYSETWDTGHATMSGSIDIPPAVPPSGHEGETWVKIDVTASWNNQGLGCCRYTGISFWGCTGGDDKGCFDNGSTSASASCTGRLGTIGIGVTGKQTWNVTLSLVGQ
jgi:hypothetical protein